MNAIQITATLLDRPPHYRSSTRSKATFAFGVFLALLTIGPDVQAKGTINFTMNGVGFLARVYGPEASNVNKTGNTITDVPPDTQTYTGARLAGSGFSAQLFGGPLGSVEAALVSIGSPSTFRTGAAAGTPAPQSQLVVPFIPPGSGGMFQVRAWDNAGGTLTSFEDGIIKGKSALFMVSSLGDGTPDSTPGLVGVSSFCLRIVWEVPTIIGHPQSQSVVVGSNVSFSGTASGPATLYYQWRKNSSPQSGATDSVLTLNTVTLGDAGNYDLVVTNDFGRATSSNAVLQVLPPNAPSISVNGRLAVGTVSSPTPATVAMASGFPSGQIFYTLDGTQSTTNSTLYTGPFALTNNAIVQAMNLSADMISIASAPAVQVLVIPTPTYSLQTSVSGSGSISVNPPTGPYLSNSVVTITATGPPGWRFDHWTGDFSGNTNPATLTMNGPRSVQAVFVPAYGTVLFNNAASGLRAPIYMPEPAAPYYRRTGNTTNGLPQGTQVYTGGLLSGSGWTAQLFAAPGADQPESVLLASAAITTFRTGSAAGFSATVLAVLTNVTADSPVATVQIRVWDNRSGLYSTWAYAEMGFQSGTLLYVGKSPLFNVEAIGGGTNPPAILSNLRSFSLYGDFLGYPPVILSQPKSQAVSAGSNVNFFVEYVPGSVHYRWRLNGNVIVDDYTNSPFHFTDVFTNVLQLTNVQASQAGIYSLEMIGPVGGFPPKPVEERTTFSSNAVLTVGNPGALTASRDQLSRVSLNWDGVFFLQTATNVNGPFTDLPGPIVFSPYTNTDLAGPRFFRLRN